MRTVALNINDGAYDRFISSLSDFKGEVELLDMDFLATKAYLQRELDEMDSGQAEMLSEDEFWKSTDEVLSKHK